MLPIVSLVYRLFIAQIYLDLFKIKTNQHKFLQYVLQYTY